MNIKKEHSITSLAKELNVSIATISRVMNNKQGVRESLRKKIRKKIEMRGYRPNTIINRQKHIAVISVMDNFVIENFVAQILAGIESYSFEQDVSTSIIFLKSNNNHKYDLLKMLRDRHCDGALFLLNSSFDNDQISELIQGGICSMMVSSRREVEGTGFIDIDSFNGGFTATNHLLNLGHTNIAFLAGPVFRDFDNQERIRGYKTAMKEAVSDITSIIVEHSPTKLTQKAGYNQALEALKLNPELTAIFANNDEMAHGAMLACVEQGKMVPEDISIIGFDDCPFSQFSIPPLTTIQQPLMEIGVEAIKMLDLKLKNTIEKLPKKIIQGRLIKRKSTCPPKQKNK